jgi:hypothetical protein
MSFILPFVVKLELPGGPSAHNPLRRVSTSSLERRGAAWGSAKGALLHSPAHRAPAVAPALHLEQLLAVVG